MKIKPTLLPFEYRLVSIDDYFLNAMPINEVQVKRDVVAYKEVVKQELKKLNNGI